MMAPSLLPATGGCRSRWARRCALACGWRSAGVTIGEGHQTTERDQAILVDERLVRSGAPGPDAPPSVWCPRAPGAGQRGAGHDGDRPTRERSEGDLSLIHISEPTRRTP